LIAGGVAADASLEGTKMDSNQHLDCVAQRQARERIAAPALFTTTLETLRQQFEQRDRERQLCWPRRLAAFAAKYEAEIQLQMSRPAVLAAARSSAIASPA